MRTRLWWVWICWYLSKTLFSILVNIYPNCHGVFPHWKCHFYMFLAFHSVRQVPWGCVWHALMLLKCHVKDWVARTEHSQLIPWWWTSGLLPTTAIMDQAIIVITAFMFWWSLISLGNTWGMELLGHGIGYYLVTIRYKISGFFFLGLEFEPRISCMLGKLSSAPAPTFWGLEIALFLAYTKRSGLFFTLNHCYF